MTTVLYPVFPGHAQETINLRELATNLVSSFSIPAFRNKNLLVNNITGDFVIDTDPQLVASIISRMLSAAINRSKGSLISVSAKMYKDLVIIQVKDHNSSNGYTLDSGLQKAQTMAEKIGGFVSVANQQQNMTTIAFSFPNLPLAA